MEDRIYAIINSNQSSARNMNIPPFSLCRKLKNTEEIFRGHIAKTCF